MHCQGPQALSLKIKQNKIKQQGNQFSDFQTSCDDFLVLGLWGISYLLNRCIPNVNDSLIDSRFRERQSDRERKCMPVKQTKYCSRESYSGPTIVMTAIRLCRNFRIVWLFFFSANFSLKIPGFKHHHLKVFSLIFILCHIYYCN